MGLHLVVAANLKLLSLSSSSRGTVVSPFLTSLVCPFLIKVAFSLRLVRRAYSDVIYGSRLFVFQLGRIAFDDGGEQLPPRRNRWVRAGRLVGQMVAQARRSPAVTEADEDSFHALSIFSL